MSRRVCILLLTAAAAQLLAVRLLCVSATHASGGSYSIQVLHPNGLPASSGDELTFLDRSAAAALESVDGLTSVQCPVDIVAFMSRSATRADSVQQPIHIALELTTPDLFIPMFLVLMQPGLKHHVAAGTVFSARADAADAMQCSPSGSEVALTYHARALLVIGEDGGNRTLAASQPFVLRILCGTGGLFASVCAQDAATDDGDTDPIPSCSLHHASPWSSPFTSAGMRTLIYNRYHPVFTPGCSAAPACSCAHGGGGWGLPASPVARVGRERWRLM